MVGPTDDSHAGTSKDLGTIPVYDNLSYSDFVARHLTPNFPFVLSSSTTSHWPARHQWVIPPSNDSGPSRPNFSALREYKDQVVPVADTSIPEYSEFRRSERRLGDVLDLWMNGEEEGKGLYVKDWHLLAELEKAGRGAGDVYEVPACLRDDWLNPPYSPEPRHSHSHSSESPSPSLSDFRFTYLGPSGTYTPLHRDVYSSYSWSANILGRKVWWLFPPTEEVWARILSNDNGEPVFDVRELAEEGGGIKVFQEEGQIIWVPSGWYHQVLNLDFCISINHNFFSAPTLPRIYSALCTSQIRVEAAIPDVKEMIIHRLGPEPSSGWEEEWVQEVQGLLERDAGWGWKGFWECVDRNVRWGPIPLDEVGRNERDGYVRTVIGMYKGRREWEMLPDVRGLVESIELLLTQEST